MSKPTVERLEELRKQWVDAGGTIVSAAKRITDAHLCDHPEEVLDEKDRQAIATLVIAAAAWSLSKKE
jgi:hypothetical protein